MLYQKILLGEKPYHIWVGNNGSFIEHRHADIELHFCIEGNFTMTVAKTEYKVSAGELVFVSPMTAHSIISSQNTKSTVLVVIVGATFLRRNFSQLSSICFSSPVLNLSNDTPTARALKSLLLECAELCGSSDPTDELILMGNIYKICAYVAKAADDHGETVNGAQKDIKAISTVEKALELIYYHYNEPITVENAATETGYGKSNFCKIFKNITGYTFHSMLNKYRCESACGLLSETDMSVSEIAQTVGFYEAKTFCRVFRSFFGITPGEYRKGNR